MTDTLMDTTIVAPATLGEAFATEARAGLGLVVWPTTCRVERFADAPAANRPFEVDADDACIQGLKAAEEKAGIRITRIDIGLEEPVALGPVPHPDFSPIIDRARAVMTVRQREALAQGYGIEFVLRGRPGQPRKLSVTVKSLIFMTKEAMRHGTSIYRTADEACEAIESSLLGGEGYTIYPDQPWLQGFTDDQPWFTNVTSIEFVVPGERLSSGDSKGAEADEKDPAPAAVKTLTENEIRARICGTADDWMDAIETFGVRVVDFDGWSAMLGRDEANWTNATVAAFSSEAEAREWVDTVNAQLYEPNL